MRQLFISRTTAIVLGTLATGLAHAAVFTLDFDTIVTGDVPAGTNIATLTIEDAAPDSVLFTLSHNATSAAGQFISTLSLNLEPFVSVAQSGQTPSNKFDGAIFGSENGITDAKLRFDLRQEFQVSGAGGGVNRLKPGESVSFTLTAAGLTASNFLATAAPVGSGRRDVIAMIHLQGIPGGGSSKIAAVPEPASMTALGVGLFALLRRRIR